MWYTKKEGPKNQKNQKVGQESHFNITHYPQKEKEESARPKQLQTQIPARMDMKLPMIPVASQEATDVPRDIFLLVFPPKWAISHYWDFQANRPSRISPWMPGSMWRQAGRTHSSGNLSQGSPPQRINRTKTWWWDLANGRHNSPRRNNRHLQTKRCSQAKLKVKVNNGRRTQNWPLIFGCIAACRVYIVL